jgi:hypothetical protein
VLLAALAAVTSAMASPDDMRRGGRVLRCVVGWGSAAGGPWPGSYYTVPGLALVGVGLAFAAVVLHRVVRRPRPGGHPGVDDAARRSAAQAVTAGTGILVLVPLLGIALTAGARLLALAGDCGRAGWTTAGWTLVGLGGAASVLACWCGALLILPPVRPAG